jgi:hypothetical protein
LLHSTGRRERVREMRSTPTPLILVSMVHC